MGDVKFYCLYCLIASRLMSSFDKQLTIQGYLKEVGLMSPAQSALLAAFRLGAAPQSLLSSLNRSSALRTSLLDNRAAKPDCDVPDPTQSSLSVVQTSRGPTRCIIVRSSVSPEVASRTQEPGTGPLGHLSDDIASGNAAQFRSGEVASPRRVVGSPIAKSPLTHRPVSHDRVSSQSPQFRFESTSAYGNDDSVVHTLPPRQHSSARARAASTHDPHPMDPSIAMLEYIRGRSPDPSRVSRTGSPPSSTRTMALSAALYEREAPGPRLHPALVANEPTVPATARHRQTWFTDAAGQSLRGGGAADVTADSSYSSHTSATTTSTTSAPPPQPHDAFGLYEGSTYNHGHTIGHPTRRSATPPHRDGVVTWRGDAPTRTSVTSAPATGASRSRSAPSPVPQPSPHSDALRRRPSGGYPSWFPPTHNALLLVSPHRRRSPSRGSREGAAADLRLRDARSLLASVPISVSRPGTHSAVVVARPPPGVAPTGRIGARDPPDGGPAKAAGGRALDPAVERAGRGTMVRGTSVGNEVSLRRGSAGDTRSRSLSGGGGGLPPPQAGLRRVDLRRPSDHWDGGRGSPPAGVHGGGHAQGEGPTNREHSHQFGLGLRVGVRGVSRPSSGDSTGCCYCGAAACVCSAPTDTTSSCSSGTCRMCDDEIGAATTATGSSFGYTTRSPSVCSHGRGSSVSPHLLSTRGLRSPRWRTGAIGRRSAATPRVELPPPRGLCGPRCGPACAHTRDRSPPGAESLNAEDAAHVPQRARSASTRDEVVEGLIAQAVSRARAASTGQRPRPSRGGMGSRSHSLPPRRHDSDSDDVPAQHPLLSPECDSVAAAHDARVRAVLGPRATAALRVHPQLDPPSVPTESTAGPAASPPPRDPRAGSAGRAESQLGTRMCISVRGGALARTVLLGGHYGSETTGGADDGDCAVLHDLPAQLPTGGGAWGRGMAGAPEGGRPAAVALGAMAAGWRAVPVASMGGQRAASATPGLAGRTERRCDTRLMAVGEGGTTGRTTGRICIGGPPAGFLGPRDVSNLLDGSVTAPSDDGDEGTDAGTSSPSSSRRGGTARGGRAGGGAATAARSRAVGRSSGPTPRTSDSALGSESPPSIVDVERSSDSLMLRGQPTGPPGGASGYGNRIGRPCHARGTSPQPHAPTVSVSGTTAMISTRTHDGIAVPSPRRRTSSVDRTAAAAAAAGSAMHAGSPSPLPIGGNPTWPAPGAPPAAETSTTSSSAFPRDMRAWARSSSHSRAHSLTPTPGTATALPPPHAPLGRHPRGLRIGSASPPVNEYTYLPHASLDTAPRAPCDVSRTVDDRVANSNVLATTGGPFSSERMAADALLDIDVSAMGDALGWRGSPSFGSATRTRGDVAVARARSALETDGHAGVPRPSSEHAVLGAVLAADHSSQYDGRSTHRDGHSVAASRSVSRGLAVRFAADGGIASPLHTPAVVIRSELMHRFGGTAGWTGAVSAAPPSSRSRDARRPVSANTEHRSGPASGPLDQRPPWNDTKRPLAQQHQYAAGRPRDAAHVAAHATHSAAHASGPPGARAREAREGMTSGDRAPAAVARNRQDSRDVAIRGPVHWSGRTVSRRATQDDDRQGRHPSRGRRLLQSAAAAAAAAAAHGSDALAELSRQLA